MDHVGRPAGEHDELPVPGRVPGGGDRQFQRRKEERIGNDSAEPPQEDAREDSLHEPAEGNAADPVDRHTARNCVEQVGVGSAVPVAPVGAADRDGPAQCRKVADEAESPPDARPLDGRKLVGDQDQVSRS